jgi:DNA-binding LacI/PurR family transcriptional regulator
MAYTEKPKPTYSEIAEVAGVSEATVSRVLNGDERVHPDRAKAVKKAVDKLGYRRNRSAAALASGKSRLIAIVIEDDLSVFSDPFWSSVSSGVSKVLMENELQTLLLVAPSNEVDGPAAHYLEGGEVDGAIFFQMHKDALVKKLAKQGLPVVIAGSPHKDAGLAYVDTDNYGGGKLATQHLFSIGCKRIAVITGDLGATAGRLRLDGFLSACKLNKYEPMKQHITNGDYSFESGRNQMTKLLAMKSRPDGVFVANDLMAVGAIKAIRDAGFGCPEDIKIVGFDDSVLAQTSRPELTTVRQDIVKLGETVANLMINVINGEKPQPIILPTELVVRESA